MYVYEYTHTHTEEMVTTPWKWEDRIAVKAFRRWVGGSVYTPGCMFSWWFCGSNMLKRRLTVTSSKHVHLSPDVCAMSSQEPHFSLKSLGFPSCLLRLHSLLLLFTLLFLSRYWCFFHHHWTRADTKWNTCMYNYNIRVIIHKCISW